MKCLYRLGIFLLRSILPVIALFNASISRLLNGRIGLFEKLDQFKKENTRPIAWFHVASLGEFEQAKPVIEALKADQKALAIVVSFFSPSGYDQLIKKPSDNIDLITYLPLDSKKQAERFVRTLNPSCVFFVKYDLWYHHIQAIKKLKIPLYLISASFRPTQIYFSRLAFFQRLVTSFDLIFTQNSESIGLLESINYQHGVLVGDTRFDRVISTANEPLNFPELEAWKGGHELIVAGSVWEEDMSLLIPVINSNPDFRWIIAPHSLDLDPMIAWMASISKKVIRYSDWDKKATDAEVILIDNIGMLSSLYQFAKIAYVGGAFGKGLHNILEPVGFQIPVVFGHLRQNEKFPEAAQSKREGCGFEVSNSIEFGKVLAQLEDGDTYAESKKAATNWLDANRGASARIIKEVSKRFLS